MGLYILIIFAAYILFDFFFGRRNVYKLLFIIPVLMSTLLLTSIPATWPKAVFAGYRIVLIVSCFVIMFVYLKDIARRKKALDEEKKKQEKKQAKKQEKKQNKKQTKK